MAARTWSLYAFLFAVMLALGACKMDDFATETVSELKKLSDGIIAKTKEGDDRKAAVAAAQSLLDNKRPDLAPKMKQVMELRGYQVSEETAANINKVRTESGLAVASLLLDADIMRESIDDPELSKALDRLTDDFTSLVDGN